MTDWDDLTEKEQLLTLISDCHKDARGFRPRGIYNDLSVEELKSVLDDLVVEANEAYEYQQKLENENYRELHKHFSNLVNMGAKDFRQALDWDMQAEDCVHDEGFQDFGFYCYKKGIAYSKERVIKRLAS